MGKLLTKVSALLLGSMVTLGAGASVTIVSGDKALSSETKVSLVTPKQKMDAGVVVSSIDLSIDGYTEKIDGGGYPVADATVKYVVSYSTGEDKGSREVSVKVYSNEEEVEDMVWEEPCYYLDKGYGDFYLSFEKNGTYTVKVTSKECPSVTGTFDINVTGIVPVAYRDYELTTSPVSSGGNYVIAAGTHALYEGDFSFNEGQGAKDVTIKDNVITTNDQYIVWVLQEKEGGAYAITERDDRYNYLGAVARGSSKKIAITGNGNADWKINYDSEDGRWEFESVGFPGNYLRYDTNVSHWVVTDSGDSNYLWPALYKINDGSSHIAALEIAKPGKTHYAIGDTFTAEGLVVNAVKTKGDQPITYRDFTPSNTHGIGFSKAIGAELNEEGSFDVTLTMNQNTDSYSVTYTIDVAEYFPTRYSKITESNAPADWRGTYLLVYENEDHSKLFDSSLGYVGLTENYFEAKVADNQIVGSRDIDMRRVQIVRNFDLGGAPYVVKLPDGDYLLGNEYGITNEPIFDASRGIASLSYGEDILSINGLPIRYNPKSGSERFKLYEPSTSNSPVSLYKLNATTSINQELTDFIDAFNNGTKTCKSDGSTDAEALTASWGSVASSYKALSPDAQGRIASTTYTHNKEEYGTVADIVDRYDYIVSRYGLADFMNRKEAGLIQLTSVPKPLSVSRVNNGAAVVVALLAIASILSVGSFFALRRRKER
ncbi:MAG: hypothetical protein E7182_01670 [Erysipelotrichaceae bacterium]|nr:hypothetical protein [Erysipelotrichaceae bacterium]